MRVALAGTLALSGACKSNAMREAYERQELNRFKDGIETVCRSSTSEVRLTMKDGKRVTLQSIGPFDQKEFEARIQISADKSISITLPPSVGLGVQSGKLMLNVVGEESSDTTLDVPTCEKGQTSMHGQAFPVMAAAHKHGYDTLMIGGALLLGYAMLSHSSSE